MILLDRRNIKAFGKILRILNNVGSSLKVLLADVFECVEPELHEVKKLVSDHAFEGHLVTSLARLTS